MPPLPPETERKPRLLVAAADDLWADTVERFFAPQGFEIVRTRTGSAALEEGAQARPDALLVERELPDIPGADLCRSLRNAPWVNPAMPIVVTTVYDLDGDQRLELIRAGAWDVLRSPVDPDEVVARLGNYLSARRAAVRAREEGLVDGVTGLYNGHGLARRCEELVAEAFRRHAALACLAIAPEGDPPLTELEAEAVARDVAHALHGVRRSDVTGRHAAVEFIILAPRTEPSGAVGLAKRVFGSLRPLRLRVGYDAVPNLREIPTDPAALIRSALEALHRVPSGSEHSPIQPFRPFEHRRPNL